ncbi:MAG: DUF5050 domain-containing protein [Bacillota bacterium]|nr:DUF5050 domain-containing protein [Bacillota bacterium]
MKKKIVAVALTLAMCFAFTGCGGDNGNKSKDNGEPKVTSIVGSWECEDVQVTNNGEKVGDDTVKLMFGEDFSSIFKLSAYGDGSADLVMMEDKNTVSWSETKDNEYKLSYPESDKKDAADMTAKLDGEKLIITVEETYKSDDKDQSMVMEFTMKYTGKKSKLIEGWNVVLNDEEVYAMSNAMIEGSFVEADGMLYGDYGGDEWGKGAFMVAKIKGDKLKDKTIIAKDTKVSNLSVYDGNVYGILDSEKIIKVEVGKTKTETIYKGTCNNMQVTKKGIYFTDEKERYCKVDLEGKNKETVLNKKVAYPYQISSKFMVYQDGADGETLHMYNMKENSDKKISNMVSYQPMLYGDYMYFYTPGNYEDVYHMCRIDMYSGKVEKAERAAIMYDYYVTPEHIIAAKGEFVTIEFDKWDTFADTSSAGSKAYPKYSNGEIWVSRCAGENFLSSETFVTDEKSSIGYSYVKDE